MTGEDVYAAARARLAAERMAAEVGRQTAAQHTAQDAARKMALEAAATKEMHEVAVRAWRELKAAGIRPAKFVHYQYSSWTGKSTYRKSSVPGDYWAVKVGRPLVLVNERGMFKCRGATSLGTPREPVVQGVTAEVLPIKLGESIYHEEADWDYPRRDWTIWANDDGRAMVDGATVLGHTLLEVAAAEDVVRQIEAVRWL